MENPDMLRFMALAWIITYQIKLFEMFSFVKNPTIKTELIFFNLQFRACCTLQLFFFFFYHGFIYTMLLGQSSTNLMPP
jgi:hypothetical protein